MQQQHYINKTWRGIDISNIEGKMLTILLGLALKYSLQYASFIAHHTLREAQSVTSQA
jgi:hypothetical protein